ncbi:HEPN domain-containing protein [Bauldia litoralis]|uniref:HEPN domain-containing protein n=1 Tax=Bauldia litoralis TaxID=665467 RepID=UPI00326749AD
MQTYLEQTVEAAETAREMRKLGDYKLARDRAYYAIFYAVAGLLDLSGEGRVREDAPFADSAALREFSSRFVQTGEASTDLGRAIAVAKNLRDKADYSEGVATPEEADEALAAMEQMLAFAEPVLRKGETES